MASKNHRIRKSSASLKLSENDSPEYSPGAISRIKVENFITYDSVEFQPGPNLNLIVAPNGTGKSTIVCAIVLGLGGKTAMVGRATQVSDYIKHGCSRAIIEIDLVSGKVPVTIRREITKTNSTWLVNGKNQTQKYVEELVSKMNIQVGNLCQFLPQDRVADFVKMSQQELLTNTEKVVGPAGMYEDHCKLKNYHTKARDLENMFQSNKDYLEKEIQKNSQLEQEVKRFEQRQRHLEKIEMLKQKRPWMEYIELRQRFKNGQEKKKDLVERLRKAQSEVAPLQISVDKARGFVEKLDKNMKDVLNDMKDHANKVQLKSRNIEELTEKINEAQHELNAKKQDEAQHKKKLQEMKHQLEGLQKELESCSENETIIQEKLEQTKRETHSINRQLTETQHEKDNAAAMKIDIERNIKGTEAELRKTQDVSERRLQVLRQINRQAHDVVLWLRQNKDRFKKTIHEPICMTVNVHNTNNAKYIENHISMNDMVSFVCEDPDDMDLFLKYVRDEQRLKVNAVKMPQQSLDNFKPKNPISHYRDMGFHSYLKDLFDAPDAVMRYLCSQYRVHSTPVGDELTNQKIDYVLKNSGFNHFYTTNKQYRVKFSKYGNREMSTLIMPLRNARLLTYSVDSLKLQELQATLKSLQQSYQDKELIFRELQQKEKDLIGNMEKLRRQAKELMSSRDLKKNLLQKIQSKITGIQHLEQNKLNIIEEEQRFNDKAHKINQNKLVVLKDLLISTKACLCCSKLRIVLSLRHAAAIKKFTSFESELRESSTMLYTLENEYERFREQQHMVKEQAKQLLVKAKKATNTPDNEELSEEKRKYFDTLPQSVLDIDSLIHDEQARVDCHFQTDERVVREFQDRQKEIQRVTLETEKHRQTLEHHQEEIETIKQRWLNPLQDLIGQINKNFSYFLRQLNCAGEVDLNTGDNPEDYEKYGIRIKVKYRDTEQLRELTAFHQSGGERSVATVLYIMALQELTRCPFRCVDEINQGMDPINERKVFELVVQTACRKSSSQYFLLTPKLLTDLDYSSNMTILVIYNGPEMISHQKWDINKYLRRRASMQT